MQLIVENKDYLENIFADIRRAAKFPIVIEYKTVKRTKTKKQLGFIFGGLMGVLRQYFLDTQGELWDIEDLKKMLYYEVGIFEEKVFPNGVHISSPVTLSAMTKGQASEFITKTLNYMESLPDLVIPPDLRNCWLLHITPEDIQRANQYSFPERDPAYLAHIRKQSCLYSGSYENVEAHHVKSNKYGGMAEKPPDWFTIPLSHKVHIDKAHSESQIELIKGLPLYGFDIETYCRLAYLRYLEHR